jgi:hypothetical protein
MMAADAQTEQKKTLKGTLAVILARVVVPLWLFTGAVLKLVDGSPSNLPAAIVKWFGGLGADLMFMLRFSIAAELVVVGVMVLLPPLARLVGIVTLGAFLPVLASDVLLGAASCGCFGAVEIHPGFTLAVDLGFLLGLILLGRGERRLALTPKLKTSGVILTGLWSMIGVVVAFGFAGGAQSDGAPLAGNPADGGSAMAAALPTDGYYFPQYENWLGQPFSGIEIASWIRGLPEDLDAGQQYVIFYRKDCEHCHELLELYFSEDLPLPTTAIAVPERDGFPTENIQPFSCSECRVAELPAGIDWFMNTPVLVRLADGVVECAAEVEPVNPECIVW